MLSLRHLAAVSALSLLAACYLPDAREATAASPEWGPGTTEMRKATALVRVTPPARLKSALETAAARTDDPDVSDFFRAHAGGGFGSGFLMVHDGGAGPAAFVVTNRHVIEESTDAEISFADGTTYKDCEVVLASTKYDLAVIALPDAALHALGPGLKPSAKDATDRLGVVATGYPGVAGHPSYQITEGKVSNAKMSMPEVGLVEPLVQHTAPIDPGSSGGPLTDESGALVGVNVMLVRQRASMFFAVPSSAVVETVREAHALLTKKRSAEWMNAELDKACAELATELGTATKSGAKLNSFVSNVAVADRGLESYAVLTQTSIAPMVRQSFYNDPIEAMRRAVGVRLDARSIVGGGATGACEKMVTPSADAFTSGRPVRRAILTKDGSAVLVSWTFEHGAWRVADADLIEPRAPAADERPASKHASAKTSAKAVKP